MIKKRTVNLCKDSDEVLKSKVLWDIAEKVLSSLKIYNTEYLLSILNKIKKGQALDLEEYQDFIAVLKDDRFTSQAEAYYNKIEVKSNIRDMIDDVKHLTLPKILRSVKEVAKTSLIKGLEVNGQAGDRFKFESYNYIVVGEGNDKLVGRIKGKVDMEEDYLLQCILADNQKILVSMEGKLLSRYDELTYRSSFGVTHGYDMVIAIREEDEKKYEGLVTEAGVQYGGMKWAEIITTHTTEEGEIYAMVANHDKKVGYVDVEGKPLYNGAVRKDVSIMKKSDTYALVKGEDDKVGIMTKAGKYCFSGIVRDEFKDLIFEGKGMKYGIFREGDKWGVTNVGGSYMFGGFRWKKVYEVTIAASKKEYAIVKDESGKMFFVTKNGRQVFGKSVLDKITNREFKVDKKYGTVYLLVEKNGKKGLITEEGTEAFGAFQWDEIGDFEYGIDGRTLLVARNENHGFLHVEHTGHHYPRGKNFG